MGNSPETIHFENLNLILILNLKSLVNTGPDDWRGTIPDNANF